MKHLLLVLVCVVLSAACKYFVVVDVDGHGDQHLWYQVDRVDQVVDGKTVTGETVRWVAQMSSSKDGTCSASRQTLVKDYRCEKVARSRTYGEAKDLATAVANIKAHFEEFKQNNSLVVDTTPQVPGK